MSDETLDPHVQVASQLFQKPEAEVTPQERAVGKQVNFTVSLGGGISQERMDAYLRENGIDPEVFDEKAQQVIVEVVEAWAAMEAGGTETTPRQTPKLDIHRRVASQLFQKPEAEVTSPERHVGKMVNFAVDAGVGIDAAKLQKWAVDAGLPADVFTSHAEELVKRWKIERDPDQDAALDALYTALDTLLSAEQWETVDALLRGWNCELERAERTLGVLTLIAHAPPDVLSERFRFRHKAATHIHYELCSEAPEALQNLVTEDLQYLHDKKLTCKTCGDTMHRFRPSPEAGRYWRCSECGNKTCVSPDGDTDAHGHYAVSENGVLVCVLCREPA